MVQKQNNVDCVVSIQYAIREEDHEWAMYHGPVYWDENHVRSSGTKLPESEAKDVIQRLEAMDYLPMANYQQLMNKPYRR